ncbi:MAG: hypothetical protein ABIS86_00250 [Streptosporangiaceae bacterium]
MTTYSLPPLKASWMTQPCPSWCITEHHSLDAPGSRICESKPAKTLLELSEPYECFGKTYLDELHASIEAPTGASLPHIAVFPCDGNGTTFTLVEAEQHARHLLALVAEARSSITQGVTP